MGDFGADAATKGLPARNVDSGEPDASEVKHSPFHPQPEVREFVTKWPWSLRHDQPLQKRCGGGPAPQPDRPRAARSILCAATLKCRRDTIRTIPRLKDEE